MFIVGRFLLGLLAGTNRDNNVFWQLLDVENNTGMILTESCAMYPAASVSGWYFGHPDSKYFAVSKIADDQLNDYAAKKGWSTEVAQSWLAPNLR